MPEVHFTEEMKAEMHKRGRINRLRNIMLELDYLILATPTSEARTLLTDINIVINHVSTLEEFTHKGM